MIRYTNEPTFMNTIQLLRIEHFLNESDALNGFRDEVNIMLQNKEIDPHVALKLWNDMIQNKHVYYADLEYEIRTIISK